MLQVKASQLFALVSEPCVYLSLSNSPGPSSTFRSEWYLRYERLGMTYTEQPVLASIPMDFYPPTISPQTQLFPIAFLPQQLQFLLAHS